MMVCKWSLEVVVDPGIYKKRGGGLLVNETMRKDLGQNIEVYLYYDVDLLQKMGSPLSATLRWSTLDDQKILTAHIRYLVFRSS